MKKILLSVVLLSASAWGQWLQGIKASTPTTNSTTITWTTCASSTSNVSYGTTTAYGSLAGSANLSRFHSVVLRGLLGSTIYHFSVSGADSTGVVVAGTDSTFTTQGAPQQPPATPPPATPPTHTVTLNWTLSVPITGVTVTGYNIYRGTISGGPYSKVGTSTGPPFTDINVPGSSGTLYYIATAVATGLESINSNEIVMVIP